MMHEAAGADPPRFSFEFRELGIDDLSEVRYVHAAAFRHLAALHYNSDEIEAFVEHVYSRGYTEQVVAAHGVAAWVSGQLAGTAAWSPANDTGQTARISDVYVGPLFSGLGIGTLLVREVEQRAMQAGFAEACVRTSVNAVPFFEGLGYAVTSHGVRATPAGRDLRVSFMRRSLA